MKYSQYDSSPWTPCDLLNAVFTLACFKMFGNLLSFTQKLKMLDMLAVKTSAFYFRIFTGKLLTWVALRVLGFFISLNASSALTPIGDIDSNDASVFIIFENCFQYRM